MAQLSINIVVLTALVLFILPRAKGLFIAHLWWLERRRGVEDDVALAPLQGGQSSAMIAVCAFWSRPLVLRDASFASHLRMRSLGLRALELFFLPRQ